MTESSTEHTWSVTLYPELDFRTASTRMRHAKWQTSLPKEGLQWKLAEVQDPINSHSPALGTRINVHRAAANLPRVFHIQTETGCHTNQKAPTDS